MGNSMIAEMSYYDKNTQLSLILRQIQVMSINEMVQRIQLLNFTTPHEIFSFCEIIIESMLLMNQHYAGKCAGIIIGIHSAMTVTYGRILMQVLDVQAEKYFNNFIRFNMSESNILQPAYGEKIAIFFANLFKFNLISNERIYAMISHPERNFHEVNFRVRILQLIREKIVHQVTKNKQIDEITRKIHDTLVSEGFVNRLNATTAQQLSQRTNSPAPKSQSNSPIPSASETKNPTASSLSRSTSQNSQNRPEIEQRTLNVQAPEITKIETKIDLNTEAKNQPSSYQSPSQRNLSSKSNQSPIVAEFEIFLKLIKDQSSGSFNLDKFKACRDSERKECTKLLLSYTLNYSQKSENYAKIAHRILQTSAKAYGKDKTFIVHLTDVCDDKLKLFKSQHKNWTEIEGFGIFLAHMYVLEVQKLYLMNTWLDETTKLAYESDFALKMLLKVLKIIHQKMKAKDPKNYQVYRKKLIEFKSKFPQRIPKMYEIWIDEFLGVSKSQKNLPQPSTSSQNQNLRSSSVASSTSDISTASKTQVSTGAIKKVPKNEYNSSIDTSSAANTNFQKYLNAIQEKKSPTYPLDEMCQASAREIKIYAAIYVQHSICHAERSEIYVTVLRTTILPSIKVENNRNAFKNHMKIFIFNEINENLNISSPNWNRVSKINNFVCELYLHDVIEFSMETWLEKLQIMAVCGDDEAMKEFNACVVKVGKKFGDKNLKVIERAKANDQEMKTNENRSKIEENKPDVKVNVELNPPDVIQYFESVISNLNKYNNEELFAAIEDIEINSNENLHIIAEFFFKSIMESNEDPVIFVYIAKTIDKNVSNEFNFRLALVDLIIHDFNTKSSQDVKNVSNLIIFIGKFYNEDWIDFAQIQMCLRKLTTTEALMNFQLFYKLIKIISIKLITTGDGIKIKEFYDVLNEGDENENAVTDLKYLKVLRTLESIWENSKIFKSNFDQFKKILRNLSEKNVKESIEKLKLMKINCDRKYSRAFIDAFMDNCENVESFVKILAEIERNQDLDIERQKKSFMPYVLTEIEEDLMNYSSVPKPKLHLMKVIIFICSLYNKNMIEVEGVKNFLNDWIEIPLEESFAAVEFLISSVGVKIDSEDEKLLDEILENLIQKSSTTEDKKKIEKLIESRKTNNEESSNDFNQFIKDLESVTNVSFLATQMKPKILANEETMKEFAQAIYNCCINDTNMIELTVKFCKCLANNKKFKEIFSIFVQSKLISIKNGEMKFDAIKLIANCYKIDLIDDETFKPWLSAKILDDLTYNQLSEINEIIVVKNSAEFSYLDDLMHEKFIVLCEEIKSDLKNVKISIENCRSEGNLDSEVD